MNQKIFIAVLAAASLQAANAAVQYTIVAPPRGTKATMEKEFEPVAQLLTRATGKKFRFQYTSNWFKYMERVRQNESGVYFDGPGFIGWRNTKFQDSVAARLAGHLQLVIVMKKQKAPAHFKLADLTAEPLCSFPPPNLDALVLENGYKNSLHWPAFHPVQSFQSALENVKSGTCKAAILPVPIIQRLGKAYGVKIVWRAAPLPNQGFSMNTDLPASVRQEIRIVLTSPKGQAATRILRAHLGGVALVPATNQEYLPAASVMKNAWAFGF